MWESGWTNFKKQQTVQGLGFVTALPESLLPESMPQNEVEVTVKRCKSNLSMKSLGQENTEPLCCHFYILLECLLSFFSVFPCSRSIKLNNTKPRIKLNLSSMISWSGYYQCIPEFDCGICHRALSQTIPGHGLKVRAVPIRRYGEVKIMLISLHPM